MKTKVSIIGYGWVGKAMHELFPEAFIYSRNIIHHNNSLIKANDNGLSWKQNKKDYQKEVNECNVAFVCVPTPNIEADCNCGCHTDSGTCYPHCCDNVDKKGKLDTSIVEECLEWCECPLLVVRSTVNPGDCDRWSRKYRKNIVMQPEYLGETPDHPFSDPTQRKFLVIGGKQADRRKLIDLYSTVYNANVNIRQMSNYYAEIVKLTENRAIAWKRAEIQELHDTLEKAGVDYYTIREAVYGDDPRFNLWWTFQYPGKKGFNSKCIPKDIYAWCAWAESCGYEPKITRAILEKNKKWIDEA